MRTLLIVIGAMGDVGVITLAGAVALGLPVRATR